MTHYTNNLTSLDISSNPNIDSLIVNSNNLTTNAIDDIFSDLAAGVVSNGLLRIDVGRSIPGSDADKATLVGRGWTITEL